MSKKTIAVDFDGVIHKYSEGWAGGEVYDEPMKDAKKFMKMLVDNGFRLVIYTTRINPEMDDHEEQRSNMIDWLIRNEFRMGKHYHDISKYKPAAIAYIDDRAVRFTTWQDVVRYFI